MKGNKSLESISHYYADKIGRHGARPEGVDWNGENSQTKRFEQLRQLLPAEDSSFSVLDLGCGYGALLPFLSKRFLNFSYLGLDICAEMIEVANRVYGSAPNVEFQCADIDGFSADYGVASGIFSVRLGFDDVQWRSHIISRIHALDVACDKGFAFNCLTKFSDAEKMKDYLYYADPCEIFSYCKTHISRNVALLHDYDLYEFTILVRKQ